ncbi:hypothetical protein [Haloarcula marina]|uniref:hypothetical protein n=1 Tax=Haloarcula marina TaxID=2961574 RepID=UPI0020B8EB8A|nr:hypothetical protein [Halomicroarcula marina]
MTVLTSLVVAPMVVTAHPPASPDHGVNETAFAPLWSNDTDDAETLTVNASAPALSTLTAGTDIPLDAPPLAVERWNEGEHDSVPHTGSAVSAAPSHATLEDGQYIRDAHVTLFAVQPSTVVHTSATERTHYVAPDGEVLGIVDFRVRTPLGRRTANRTVTHSVVEARVNETRLLVDGDVVARANRTRAPRLSYTGLVAKTEPTTLTLLTTIETRIQTERRTCREYNATQETCTRWDRRVSYRAESVRVSDSVAVQPYDLEVSGYVGRYPNGDLGVVVYKSDPWGGYKLTETAATDSSSEGRVAGVWRFYTARNPAWDTLERRRAGTTTRVHSAVHPLQVHAFPIEVGPTATPRNSVGILRAFGEELSPPTLPANVSLDVVSEPYLASYGLATRWEADIETPADTESEAEASNDFETTAITARGLVRGVETTRSLDTLAEVPIRESNLTLTLQNQSAGSATVRVILRDAETGEPIETHSRDGYLLVDGERIQTNATGVAVFTVPPRHDAVSARHVPGEWWLNIPGYVGDSDTVYIRSPVLGLLSTLFVFSVPVSLFLLAVWLIDRITGWGIWPPWRSL